MSAISTVVELTVGFDRELLVWGVAGVGEVDIDDSSEGKVGGVVSLSQMEIVFEIGFSG